MNNLRSTYTKIKAGIYSIFNPILKPLKEFWHPVGLKWASFMSPVTKAWEAYTEKHPLESKIFGWIGRLIKWGMYLVLGLIFLTWLGVFGKLPSSTELRQIENADASEIFTSDGVLIGKFYTENRKTIVLDSISPYLITALLAIEDKRFFEHSGIDFRSWMRVFKGIATNSSGLGGGSTLSQQLSKNLYPRRNYKVPGISLFINKIRENIISIRLEKIYNKEELLTMYLNTVPFGGTRFGIQEASRYFYGLKPKELNPAQSATLIGMLKATTALDPVRNPKNSKKRRDLVLAQMLKNKDFRFDSDQMATISKMINTGAITEKQYNELIKTPINAKAHDDIGNNEGLATYFREYLRTKELPKILKGMTKEDGSSYNSYTDGLKIITTIDSRMQKHAEEAVAKHMSYIQKAFRKHWSGVKDEKPWGDDKWIVEQVKKSDRYALLSDKGYSDKQIDSIFKIPVKMKVFGWYGGLASERDTTMTPLDSVRYYFTTLNCGFMAMEHKNGYIKAWVGGTDFKNFKYDHILSKRQVGSTFKPIVYAAALQDSIKPCKYLQNKEVTIEDWSPKNSDEDYGGWYSMVGGLAYSVNVIAAQLIEKVGIQKTIDLAAKLGVTSSLPREFGISLGAADISLFDMMKVYGSMANNGLRPEPIAILKIMDRYGKVIYDYEKLVVKNPKLGPHVEALDTASAYAMTRMMQNVVVYGTANTLKSQYCRHCDLAAKTGTTQNHSDGWLMAYNPDLVTGAWVGGPSPAVRFRTMDYGRGAALALPIVGNFWYKLSIDPKSAKLTQKTFKRNEKIISEMSCPLRLGYSPDKYFAVMQDSTLRDSMLRTGFRGLRNIIDEMFPEEGEEETLDPTLEGEIIDSGSESVKGNELDKKDPKAILPNDPKTKNVSADVTMKPEEKSSNPQSKGKTTQEKPKTSSDPKAKPSDVKSGTKKSVEDPKAKKSGGNL
jgi:penicillin-binding protein 1A